MSSTRRRVIGSLAGALGVAAAGGAVSLLRQQRSISRRAGEDVAFGSLRSEPTTVVADDGVPLHVEIDEVDQTHGLDRSGRLFRRVRGGPPPFNRRGLGVDEQVGRHAPASGSSSAGPVRRRASPIALAGRTQSRYFGLPNA